MTNLIRGELLKLRTSRMFWGYAAASLAFIPLVIAQSIHAASTTGQVRLDSAEGVRNVMAAASSGGTLLLILGIMAVAGELRHRTATRTYLVAPNRRHVVEAKLAAIAVVGLLLAAAASVLTLAIAVPWLTSMGVDVGSYAGDIAVVLAGAAAATVLSGVAGVGIGALIPNQTAAITVTLLWIFTVESILVAFAPSVGRWLPGGASAAMTDVATPAGGLLPMWAGALLFTAYGLAFAAAGTELLVRRDIP
jgi:ABC-2 type transport system permease protein